MTNATKFSGKTRTESDLIGTKEIPVEALYGVQSMRGFENFKISGRLMNDYPAFIVGMAITKKGAAIANHKQGKLTDEQYKAICQACDELIAGKHHEYFLSDMIQGGAGTTVNMNANEVIANRALEIMGHQHGEYQFCSPNDHVNASQSTNDAYPTAFHFGVYIKSQELMKAMELFINSLENKAREFAHVVKMGRTQLQDGVPMTLGQTFQAFADGMKKGLEDLKECTEELLCINMGATAIGTGICSEPGYSKLCVEALREITGWNVTLAEDLIEATSATDVLVGYSSELKRIALRSIKICNDLRLMGSGPRCGIHELFLPEMQPGSSIMPGKVNPVIPEVVNQVAFNIIGNDMTIAMATEAGQLELNAFEPIIFYNLFQSIETLSYAVHTLVDNCISGITANVDKCRDEVLGSVGIITAICPHVGYEKAAILAKEAIRTGASVRDLILRDGLLTEKELDIILDPYSMTEPGISGEELLDGKEPNFD